MTMSLGELAKCLHAEAPWLNSSIEDKLADDIEPLVKLTNLARPCDAKASSLSFLFGLGAQNINEAELHEAGAVLVDRANAHRVARPFVVDKPLIALARANHWLPVLRSHVVDTVGSKTRCTSVENNLVGLPINREYREDTLIHETAVLGNGVMVGDKTQIGANSSIGDGVRIGNFCTIGANVTINGPVKIGNRVHIDANSVIGSDAFMYVSDGGHWLKVPGFCGVIINDDVDIGAGSTLDKGLIEYTVIGRGSKLDSQVHLGHGVKIGQDTVIAARTTVAGEAIIGTGCRIGGGSAINEGVRISDNVTLLGMSAVTRSLEAEGEYTSAWPVQPRLEWWKQLASLRLLAKRG